MTVAVIAIIIAVAILAVLTWHEYQRRRPLGAGSGFIAERAPTVLVVDDEPAVLDSTGNMLARAGYDVLLAASPTVALALVRDQPGPIDVLVSDVVMPGATGHELAADVRKLWPNAGIVLCTGSTARALERHEMRGDGHARVLQKPVERAALLDAVKAVLPESRR